MARYLQLRVFDFVMDHTGDYDQLPGRSHTTIPHWGTVLFDHESEAVVYDMVCVRRLQRGAVLANAAAVAPAAQQPSSIRGMPWTSTRALGFTMPSACDKLTAPLPQHCHNALTQSRHSTTTPGAFGGP